RAPYWQAPASRSPPNRRQLPPRSTSALRAASARRLAATFAPRSHPTGRPEARSQNALFDGVLDDPPVRHAVCFGPFDDILVVEIDDAHQLGELRIAWQHRARPMRYVVHVA